MDVITPWLQSLLSSLGVWGQLAAMVLPVIILWYREKYRPSKPTPAPAPIDPNTPAQPSGRPLLDMLLNLLGLKRSEVTPEHLAQIKGEVDELIAEKHAEHTEQSKAFGELITPFSPAVK